MKTIFENVIKQGSYDLVDLLAKIDFYYISGKLTPEEFEYLCSFAREKAIGALSYDVKTEIEALWKAIRELQNNQKTEDPEHEEEEVQEFIQPTGAHDAYNTNDKVLFEGEIYQSLIDNNVWSPAVYPNGWEKISE